ncbi:MAG: hypothetical protein HY724_02120 [Candidatus Rokubacteria bacterium]|nr:hypothetical protein [Candidatus Rokubacteria bacterium]
MTSDRLARDYLRRAEARRKALDTLMASGAYADVVRESQEVLELILNGLVPAFELFGEADAGRALEVVERLLGMYRRLLGEQG